MIKEAYLYKKEKNKIRCLACHHHCLVLENKTGFCGVRKNISGKLFSLVYQNPVALHLDPIEKKPLFHFLPGSSSLSFGTVGCNLRCLYCQNWDISQATRNGRGIFGDKIPIDQIIDLAVRNGCQSISYTYNEPTIFIEFSYDTAKLAKEKGLKNVWVSNGYYTKETLKLISPYLEAVNIDLKSFSDQFYQRLCGAKLEPVLEAIKLTRKSGIWLELTTLLIPNYNDSKEELKQIAEFIASLDKNIPWHISRFFPHYKMSDISPTEIKELEEAYQIGKEAGLNFVYLGNVINKKYESTYCPKCGNILIEREGYQIKNLLKEDRCFGCGEKIKGVFKPNSSPNKVKKD